MGIWIDAVEARARLIHQEIAGAQMLARSRGLDPQVFSGGLYDELARLYRDNYAYAQLADHADLIARYRGPGVVNREPPISLVTCLFGKLKEEIRAIAVTLLLLYAYCVGTVSSARSSGPATRIWPSGCSRAISSRPQPHQ